MTHHADLKSVVRARMAETGETYTAAQAALRAADDAARAEQEAVVRRLFQGDRLITIPVKRRTRVHVLLHLVGWFEPGREYPEKVVNEILRRADDDVAYLRRELVEYGYLTRADGIYRLVETLPERSPNVAQEIPAWEDVWLPRHLGVARRR